MKRNVGLGAILSECSESQTRLCGFRWSLESDDGNKPAVIVVDPYPRYLLTSSSSSKEKQLFSLLFIMCK